MPSPPSHPKTGKSKVSPFLRVKRAFAKALKHREAFLSRPLSPVEKSQLHVAVHKQCHIKRNIDKPLPPPPTTTCRHDCSATVELILSRMSRLSQDFCSLLERTEFAALQSPCSKVDHFWKSHINYSVPQLDDRCTFSYFEYYNSLFPHPFDDTRVTPPHFNSCCKSCQRRRLNYVFEFDNELYTSLKNESKLHFVNFDFYWKYYFIGKSSCD